MSVDTHDAKLGIFPVPVRRDVVEDEAEVLFGTGLERGGGDGFNIDIRFAHANELEGLGFVLRNLVGVVPKEHLHRYAGYGARALIHNVSVEIGDFAAREVGRLAHGEIRDGEAGSVGVLGGRDGGDAGHGLAVLEDKKHDSGDYEDNRGSDRQGQPVALPGFGGADQFEIRWSAHVRILHPFRKEYAAEPRSL